MNYESIDEMERQAFQVRNVPGTAAIERRKNQTLTVTMEHSPLYKYHLSGRQISKIEAIDWLKNAER